MDQNQTQSKNLNPDLKQTRSFRDRLAKFAKEDGITVLIVLILVTAYALLRTQGDTFESIEVLKSSFEGGKPTVIEFYSNNCSICLTSKPKVAQLERELQDFAQVLKLNVKDPVNQTLANQMGVSGIPTFFVIDPNGNIIYARAGSPDTQAIAQIVFDISNLN